MLRRGYEVKKKQRKTCMKEYFLKRDAANSNQHSEQIIKLGLGSKADRFGFENGVGYLNRF
jgi:hypothetical protein